MTVDAQVDVIGRATGRPTGPIRPAVSRSIGALVRSLRPEEVLFVVFATALVVLLLVTGESGIVGYRLVQDWRYLAIVVGLALAIFARGYRRAEGCGTRGERAAAGRHLALRTLREFGPLFFCLSAYEVLHDLTPVLRPVPEDHLLVASDHFLLHTDVGAWLDTHIGSVPMTRVLTICYISYAFASPIYGGIQYFFGRYRAFHDFALAITITAFLGYVGYLVLPAVGPYLYQHDVYHTPLPGWGHGGVLDLISRLKGSARDAFPSLHTAMTTVVLGSMWRDARKLFWLYLPMAAGLYLSTMYLRVHYATDVVAGFAVGFLALWLGPKINRWWYAHPVGGRELRRDVPGR